jgi:hypothetical protein
MFDHLVWWGEALKAARHKPAPAAAEPDRECRWSRFHMVRIMQS